MKNKLALFDFDGTITIKDTFLELIKYQKGKVLFYLGFLILSPIFIAYKLGFIPNWKAKEYVLTYFFKGTSMIEFQANCNAFAENIIPHLLRPDALKKINELKESNFRIIVVSASAESWVRPWCNLMKLECLGTCLETKEDKLTGRITGKNCYGVEKVVKIKQHIKLGDYSTIHVYGDSKGDKEMLELASHHYYKPFRMSQLKVQGQL